MALNAKGYKMLRILFMMLIICSCGVAFPQTGTLDPPLTDAEVLASPRRGSAPKITMQDALTLALNFADKEKVDLASRYLFEARWVSDRIGEARTWHFWWVGFGTLGDSRYDVKFTVSDDGDVCRVKLDAGSQSPQPPPRVSSCLMSPR